MALPISNIDPAVEAADIYQQHLNIVTHATMAGDVDRIVQYLGFPNHMRTVDSEAVLTTPQQMIDSISAQLESMRRLGITEYHRICRSAAYSNDDKTEIKGQHETHMLSGGSHAIRPFRARITLRLTDDGWKAFAIRTELRDRDLTMINPLFKQPSKTQGNAKD